MPAEDDWVVGFHGSSKRAVELSVFGDDDQVVGRGQVEEVADGSETAVGRKVEAMLRHSGGIGSEPAQFDSEFCSDIREQCLGICGQPTRTASEDVDPIEGLSSGYFIQQVRLGYICALDVVRSGARCVRTRLRQ